MSYGPANCHISLTASDPKWIAAQLRKTADQFDPMRPIMGRVFAFMLGAICIAAMDYGDVWICVGQCNAMEGPP